MSICLFFIAHRRLKKKQPSYFTIKGHVCSCDDVRVIHFLFQMELECSL
jgi:hypothetical protein